MKRSFCPGFALLIASGCTVTIPTVPPTPSSYYSYYERTDADNSGGGWCYYEGPHSTSSPGGNY